MQIGNVEQFLEINKKKMFEITHLVNDLPLLTINNEKEYVFLNGAGIGVDSLVCYEQEQAMKKFEKTSYFKVALKVIKNFKPYTLDLTVDGKHQRFEWR